MINKNQFEKSIIFLKDNMSSFIYKAYGEFVTCLDELSSIYTKAAKEQMYTYNKASEKLLDSRSFMSAYLKALHGGVALLKIDNVCDKIQTSINWEDKNISPDEAFYNVTSSDIYAPVNSIKGSIFPSMNSDIEPNHGWGYRSYGILIKFEIDSEYTDINSNKDLINRDLSFGYGTISGMNGDDTVLDHLQSICYVDLTSLFNSFFTELLGFTTGSNDTEGPVFIERLNSMVVSARDDEISEKIISNLISYLTSQVIATYLVYASKLHGTKNDVYTWAYTAFVKDSVSYIDKAYYPTNAPITISSGHGIYGNGKYVEDDKISDPVMNQIATELSGHDDQLLIESTKKLIYRSIRLQYSTWATIMSAILSTKSDPTSTYDSHNKSNIVEKNALSASEWNSSYSYILLFVKKVLKTYLSARYRTYNTSLQLDLSANTYQSSTAGSKIITVIKDETAVSYLKEISKSTKDELFIGTTGLLLSVLKADKVSTQLLAKIFLQASYLLMLDKIHTKSGTYLNDIDNSTGKTKLALYEEIYYGVANNVSEEIDEYTSLYEYDGKIAEGIDENFVSVIKNVVNGYTPFITNFNEDRLRTSADYPAVSDVLYNNDTNSSLPDSLKVYLNRLDKEPMTTEMKYNILSRIISIPIKSDFDKISDFSFETRCQAAHYPNEDGSMFPKNKIVLDSIRIMNSEDKYLFRTLESVDNKVEELGTMLDLSTEGADGMANNGCYNALASIGSGICSMEIQSEEPNKVITEDGIPNTVINEENNIIKPDSSSPEDQMFFTTESMHNKSEQETEKRIIDNIDNKFGFLFNKYVLGMK